MSYCFGIVPTLFRSNIFTSRAPYRTRTSTAVQSIAAAFLMRNTKSRISLVIRKFSLCIMNVFVIIPTMFRFNIFITHAPHGTGLEVKPCCARLRNTKKSNFVKYSRKLAVYE